MSNQEFTDGPAESTTADESAGSDSGSENKGMMLILSYLWILALIPLLVEKNDAEVQWHAKNGLVWTVAEFLMHVVLTIIGFLFSFMLSIMPSMLSMLSIGGCFVPVVLVVIWVVVRVLAVMKAFKGERMKLPVLSRFAEKF